MSVPLRIEDSLGLQQPSQPFLSRRHEDWDPFYDQRTGVQNCMSVLRGCLHPIEVNFHKLSLAKPCQSDAASITL